MERGPVGGNDRRPDLAAVSDAMPCEPERRRRADLSDIRSRARLSVRLPLPVVAAVGSNFRAGVERRRAFGRRKRHETMREPMERGQGRGNDRRPDVAAVSGAMPCAPALSRGPVARGHSLPRPAPAPTPSPASQSGSPFPWWQPSAPAAPNAGSPSALRPGQYTTELQARARCPSDTVVWVNTPTRIYHYSGTHYYGHTRKGAYMCEADARAAGYRAARNREREVQTH